MLCQLVNVLSYSAVLPFLPLYLRELGVGEREVVVWTGAVQSMSAGIMIVATPLWGALADRMGRKLMVVRALLAGSVTVGLLGTVVAPWQVLILRGIQGATTGTNSSLIALAASVIPTAHLGAGMGFLQTAQFLGASFGPIVGGLLSSTFGFRGAFAASAATLFVVALFAWRFLDDPQSRKVKTGTGGGLLERLTSVGRLPRIRRPVLAAFAYQGAYAVGFTMLPLHAADLAATEMDATTIVSFTLTANALGIASGAAVLGWLGGRIGEGRLTIASLTCAALFSLLQVAATEPWQLVGLRLALGFCAGGVLPSLRSILGKEAAANTQANASLGAVYGLSQSALSGGMAVGPLVATVVATTISIPGTHAATALAFFGVAGWWLWVQRTYGPPGRRTERDQD